MHQGRLLCEAVPSAFLASFCSLYSGAYVVHGDVWRSRAKSVLVDSEAVLHEVQRTALRCRKQAAVAEFYS